VTILAFGSFLVYPAKQAFAPINWNAYLYAATTSGKRSKEISLNWSTSYGTSCTPVKLMLRYNKDTGAPDPTKPLAGTLLKYLDTDESSTQHLLVHADTKYAYTIYGCEGANCLITCTTTTNESNDATTERERWVLQGIHDYDQDTGARVLGTATWPEQHCPELYRFRTGNSYTGKMGLHFHGENSTGDAYGVWVAHTTTTAWEDNWNDPTKWADPIMIASSTSSGDNQGPKNIMVVPTVDDEDNDRMRLFWTSTDDKTNPTYFRLQSALSTDADGDDYGLCCSDTGDCSSTSNCSLGGFDEVCCDYDDAGAELRMEYDVDEGPCLRDVGWHGHDIWDDMGPRWDPASDELVLLFSGHASEDAGEGCGECYNHGTYGEADIDLWYWDTGGGCDTGDTGPEAQFCLSIEEEDDGEYPSGTDWCPDESMVDFHDPFGLPYPGGEIKVYFKKEEQLWKVGYSSDNGRSFEDTSAIEFYFEDEDTGDTAVDTDDAMYPGCVDDPTIIAWKSGAFTKEVMVLLPHIPINAEDHRCFSTQDTSVPFEDIDTFRGLVVAVLGNG
jgi:hypothetical protein